MSSSTTILLFVGLYLLICIAVGIWSLKKTKSTSEFFMAGRNLGVMLTAFAVFSSTMSGFGFVGGPGLVYRMGMSSVWMVVCSGLGFIVTFSLLGKRIRLFAELRNCISLPDVVMARYKSNAVRAWVAIAILLGVLGYMATQILAMAIVLRDIFVETTFFSGISLEWCVFIAVSVLVFYTVTGGILASVYTDFIQGMIMVVASVLVFLAVLSSFDGGMGGISRAIAADNPGAISPWGTIGIVGCLSWFFVFGLGASGQPHVITKLMMNKKVSDVKNILPVTISGYLLIALLWVGIGLVMRALVVSGGHPPLATPDSAAAEFLQNYTHPILAGIVFAALFAAIMSTADGFLNIGTAALIHDLPAAMSRTIKNELLWARIVTVVLAVVSAYFALYMDDLVAILGAFGWGTFAAALTPVVALGLNWKRATPLAATSAIIVSLVVNFSLKVGKVSMPLNIDVGAVALLVSLIVFIGISLISSPPELDDDVSRVMDL